MISIYQKIEELKEIILLKKEITDFRIILRINNRLNLIIICNKTVQLNLDHLEINQKIDIDFYTEIEKNNDDYLKEIFQSDQKIILNSRRNLSNLLDNYHETSKKSNTKVITFYSYKGGVGRSTTLASCAAYLSNLQNKKIVIIDCDFEAPGFNNYYLDEPGQLNFNNGLIEYFSEIEFDENTEVKDFLREIGKDFSGEGQIFVMPAGNLSDEEISNVKEISTHKMQYLHGLSKLEINNKSIIQEKFNNLISKIDTVVDPDYIFIDSRTGFNDIFGITALGISDLVVGFFGNNVQNLPGLNFFIENVCFSNRKINSIIINSIISRRSSFNNFQSSVNEKIENLNLLNDFDENQISIKCFPISRYDLLETIGSKEESKEDFIDLIRNKRFPDYTDFFDHLLKILDNLNEIPEKLDNRYEVSTKITEPEVNYTQKINQLGEKITKTSLRESYELISSLNKDDSNGTQKYLKQIIKKKLKDHYPKLYAEHSTLEMKKNIFYRKSMEDIFNPNKFIILGNKGTGKTFLYDALKIPEVVEKIKNKAQKKGNYEFFHLIDNKSSKFIDTSIFDDLLIENNESFFRKFWLVYIWCSIMQNSFEKLGFQSKLDVFDIKDDLRTKNKFVDLIQNEKKIIEIETELEELDSFLKKSQSQKNLIVIFDGLDLVVKPLNWHIRIIPLINFWRNTSYSRISAKLFLRSDLFEKLSNITNVKELKNQSISIEWNQQELFSYFFKLILTSSDDLFFKYMFFTRYFTYEIVKQTQQKSSDDKQVPLDDYYLKPMVETFFGKFAGTQNDPRFGESYEWFFRNLKNANNTLSLRPFIDLLENSLNFAYSNDNIHYPILPSVYFSHGDARTKAIENHFTDLVSEKGNEDLLKVCNYIRQKKSKNVVSITNSKNDFDSILSEIIQNEKTENDTVEKLISLLTLNGIIHQQFTSKGITYSFALLYKYYLGLKGKIN